MSDRDWMLDPTRHCKGSTLMFPTDSRGVTVARAICFPPGGDPCPVWQQCKQYALKHRMEYGVWAGMGMREKKRKTKTDPDPIEHGTDAGWYRHERGHNRPCPECVAAHYRANTRQVTA